MFRLKVKEVAEAKGTSRRQLFLRSGVDITTIRKIFRDPQTVVTVETLTRLADVLEVDVSALIESVPDQPDKPAKAGESGKPAKARESNKSAKVRESNKPAKARESDKPAKAGESDKSNSDNTPAP